MTATTGFANLSSEDRYFPPPARFAEQANVTATAYDDASRPAGVLGRRRRAGCAGRSRGPALDWSDAPFAKWFVGGRLNVAVNCVDRHVDAGRGEQGRHHFEAEDGHQRDHHLRRPASAGSRRRPTR